MCIRDRFGSDLDAITRKQLARGERLVELLKQPQFKPMPVELQVVSITAANMGLLDELELSKIAEFEQGLHDFLESSHADLLKEIRENGSLGKENQSVFNKALEEFGENFVASSATSASEKASVKEAESSESSEARA